MRNVKWFLHGFVAVTVMAVISGPAATQNAVPMLINYQGELRSPATGEILPDGTYDALFRIYEVESGGSPLWEGAHSSANGNPVQLADGIFSVILGSGTGNALDASVFSGPGRWLEIRVGGETLSPRQRITSTAFSIVSENSRLLSGREASDFAEDAEVAAAISAHAAVADVHHARYTDAEAVEAMGAKADENPLNHDKTMSLPWERLTDVPPGFSDAEDNDTTYTAGAGLMLLDSRFNVVFDGGGAADTASRSDHHHDGVYAPDAHTHDAGTIVSGILDSGRFSAYNDLATEGRLDGDAGTDLMTIDGGKGTYWALEGNGGTNPAAHFVGTTDNQALEVRVNNARAVRLEPGSSPNIIGGYVTNRATAGVVGAAVGGGGEAGAANRVADDFGTVGGGRNNQAGDDAGTTSDRAYATVGGGAGNLASGMYATVGGGLGNRVTADYGTIAGGGRTDPANPLLGNLVFDQYGSIGGGGDNWAGSDDGNPTSSLYVTVGGGWLNWAPSQLATVGGGFANQAKGFAATVGGGTSNTASGDVAIVSGGAQNMASGAVATVSGGSSNDATGESATIGGGRDNMASGDLATVGGGAYNEANANYATIAGGGPSDPVNPSTTRNLVTDDYGTIGGGGNNQAGDNAGTASDANFATVGGGHSNIAGAFSATVAGGAVNTANAPWAAIGGGNWNKVTDENGTVAGGNSNQAGDDAGTTQDASYATVSGGKGNSAAAPYATIGGGSDNQMVAMSPGHLPDYATIGGGEGNTIEGWGGNMLPGACATIGGGSDNAVGEDCATVGGGASNTVNGAYGTIGGGADNTVGGDAWYSTIGGGRGNTVPGDVFHATIGGGFENTVDGNYGTIPGGYRNTSRGLSFAAGFRAKANHVGAFVWGDFQEADVASTADNQVTFRCKGGVRFLSGSGGSNQMVSWAPGSSSWSFTSDQNLKENFVEVDPRGVLDKVSALPIAEWNFKGYSDRHIGPVAQDFHALFPLGGSDTMIDSGDLQGVSLAAIQGLHNLMQEKDAEISTLKRQNAKLEERLTALEALVQTLAKERKGEER